MYNSHIDIYNSYIISPFIPISFQSLSRSSTNTAVRIISVAMFRSYCDGAAKDGAIPSLLSMVSEATVVPGEECAVQVRIAACPTATVLFGAVISIPDS